MISDKIDDRWSMIRLMTRFIVCVNYYDKWWDWWSMIDDKIDDKIYCVCKLLWSVIRLMIDDRW
jgi:hypothetical protein